MAAAHTHKCVIVVICMAMIACAIMLSFAYVDGISYAVDNIAYSNVLDDLKKDTSFDISYYPDKPEDNSLQVITVAESEDDELFVYVYQPSALARPLTAASVDLSTTIYDEIAFHNYHLRLLNRQGVFGKYLVEGLTVRRDGTRYYAITDILRPWIEGLDDPATGGNTISEVPFTVAKQWKFGTLNGESFVQVVDIETIDITSKYCGFVRYDDGFVLREGACDSHFVAFDTDRPIDQLIEADVYYTKQSFRNVVATGYGGVSDFGEKIPCEAHLQCDQDVTHEGGGLFGQKYSWKRIQTVDEFISSVEFEKQVYQGGLFDVIYSSRLNDEAISALKSAKWVLRYYESDWNLKITNPFMGTSEETSTICGDAKILRLKYVTNGISYNLGVVDNKQSGDPFDPVNDTQYTVEPSDWLAALWEIIKKVLIVTAVIAAVVLIVWVITKIVTANKRPKVVINNGTQKGHQKPKRKPVATRKTKKGEKKK